MHLILHFKQGPLYYNDLKTVNGIEHTTFRDTVHALHPTKHNQELINCMEETSQIKMPSVLHRLFVSICVHNNMNTI